jgi:hypothetical protein
MCNLGSPPSGDLARIDRNYCPLPAVIKRCGEKELERTCNHIIGVTCVANSPAVTSVSYQGNRDLVGFIRLLQLFCQFSIRRFEASSNNYSTSTSVQVPRTWYQLHLLHRYLVPGTLYLYSSIEIMYKNMVQSWYLVPGTWYF